MKLTKDEKQAFLALKKIIDFYTEEAQKTDESFRKVFQEDYFYYSFDKLCHERLQLTTRDYRLIKRILGIDLKEVTSRKKEVEKFARNKDTKHIEFLNPYSPSSYENKVVKYGYFPFQIKEKKEVDSPSTKEQDKKNHES